MFNLIDLLITILIISGSCNVFLGIKTVNLRRSLNQTEIENQVLTEKLNTKIFEQDLILKEVKEFSREAELFRKAMYDAGMVKYGPVNDSATDIAKDFENGAISMK